MSDPEVIDVDPVPTKALTEWRPSALAEMPDEQFAQRLESASKERKRIAQIQRAVMTEEVDFGVIPGTNKPTLLKPGAETLNKMAHYVPSYPPDAIVRVTGDGVDTPAIHYHIKCCLHRDHTENPIEFEGLGSCNTHEKKYRYRTGGPPCPTCGQMLRESKHHKEWYCWKKRGGCGATFELKEFEAVEGENPDPHDLDNTILKMAKKRAYIDATLAAHACSGIFTQDVESQKTAPPEPPAPPPERHFAGEDRTGTRGKPPQRKKAARKKAARKQAKPPERSRATQPADDEKITVMAAQAFYIACDESAANLGDESVTKDDIAQDVLSQFDYIKEHEGKLHASYLLLRDYAEARRLVREWDGPIEKES